MVKRYRKKPVIIEAFYYRDRGDDFNLMRWCDEIGGSRQIEFGDSGAVIKTLEGDMMASPGDYIIRGVKGELYPCKPDIFAQTYEEVKAYPPTPGLPESRLKEMEELLNGAGEFWHPADMKQLIEVDMPQLIAEVHDHP